MPKHERMTTWWMHWPDLQWPDSDNLDRIKARAEGLAKADVTAAMIFGTHFRWDWMPVFPLLHDYLATVSEEHIFPSCQIRGLKHWLANSS